MIKKSNIFFLLISISIIYSNENPILNSIGNQSTAEDTSISIVLSAQDSDGDALIYSANISGNADFSISQNILLIAPHLNFNGTINVTVFVSDGNGGQDSETFILTVIPINDIPIAFVIENLIVDEDSPDYLLNLTPYFDDVENGDNLSYSANCSNSGVLSCNIQENSINIDFLLNKYGSYQINILADDGEDSVSNTIIVIVNPVNDSPILDNIPQPSSVIELGSLYEFLIDPTGTDVDDGQFNFAISTSPPGDYTIAATENNEYGIFNWTPNSIGSFPISISVSDFNATGGSNGVQVTDYSFIVQVVEDNQNVPPEIQEIPNSNIDEDSSFSYTLDISDLETNTSQLAVNVYDEYPAHPSYSTNLSVSYNNNSWKLNVDPESNWNGDINIILSVSDGINSNIEEFLLTIDPVNDPPNFSFINPMEIDEDDQNYTYNFSIQDIDAVSYYNKTPLETINYEITSNSNEIIATLMYDQITFQNEGGFNDSDDINQIEFSLEDDFFGSQEFTLNIYDSDNESYSQDFFVTVNNVNDSPVISPTISAQSFDEDTISDPILVYGIDDVSNLDYYDSNPSNFIYNCFCIGCNVGCEVQNGNEIILYNLVEHFNGDDIVRITVDDGDGGSGYQDVSITVNPINDAPEALDVNESTNEDNSVLINFSGFDIDGDELNYTVVDNPSNGIVVNNNDGTVTYSPNDNFNGQDVFTFIVNDGSLDSENIGTITIIVNEGNDAPLLSNIEDVLFNEDESISISVSAFDVDENLLTFSCDSTDSIFCSVDNTEITFTALEHYFGQDSLLITVSDSELSDSQKVFVQVLSVNDAPITSDYSNTINEDDVLVIDLTQYVQDVETQSSDLVYLLVDQAENGQCINNNNGTFNYSPIENYPFTNNSGIDLCTFKVQDEGPENFESNISNIEILVNNINDVPLLNSIGDVLFNEDDSTVVTASALDVDGDFLNFSCESTDSIFCSIDDTQITFTAFEHYFGSDSLMVLVTDSVLVDSQKVFVQVSSINDPPISQNDTISVTEDLQEIFNLFGEEVYNENNGLSFNIVDSTNYGFCSLDSNIVTYLPNLDYIGSDTLLYSVSDGSLSDTSQIIFNVINVNDPPQMLNILDNNMSFVDTSETGNYIIEIFEDSTLSFNFVGNDVDGDNIVYSVLAIDSVFSSSINSDTFEVSSVIEDFNSDVDSLDFRLAQIMLDDGKEGKDTINCNIVIHAVNDPPIITLDLLDQGQYKFFESDEGDVIFDDSLQVLSFKFDVIDVDTHRDSLKINHVINDNSTDPYPVVNYDFNYNKLDSLITIKLHKDFNGDIISTFFVNDNDSTSLDSSSHNGIGEVQNKILINQVNDTISNFSIYEDFINDTLYQNLDNYDSSMYFNDDTLSFKIPKQIDNVDFNYLKDVLFSFSDYSGFIEDSMYYYQSYEIDNSEMYNNLGPGDLNTDVVLEFPFIWEKGSDVDTYPTLNKIPEQLFYRLELFDGTNYLILKDSIPDLDSDYMSVLSTIDYNPNIEKKLSCYNQSDLYHPDSTYSECILYTNGEQLYNWRVIANNYSTQMIDTLSSGDNLSLKDFLIDIQVAESDFSINLNQIFYEYFDMYFYNSDNFINNSNSFYDIMTSYSNNIYINYHRNGMELDSEISLNEFENDNYNIFNSTGSFANFGNMDIFFISNDLRDNAYINKYAMNYQFIVPSSFNSFRSSSEILSVEFDNSNYINDGVILIYENSFKYNPFFKDMIILSDLITVVSTPIPNNNFLLKFDISKINNSDYRDIDKIQVYSVINNNFEIVNTFKSGHYLSANVSDLSAYVLVYNNDENLSENYVPDVFGISSCYPNPFNPILNINYSIDVGSKVSIDVYDLLGKKVINLFDGYKNSGTYNISWDGTNYFGQNVSSGIYFIKIQNLNSTDSKKVTLLK
ncbi:MAG: hypothetical protein CMG64_05065 [Candidatus Marinimicrobia bacterium]|nr:hypothetical protein [Candidatus Neomarinimicrobiota bacterium]